MFNLFFAASMDMYTYIYFMGSIRLHLGHLTNTLGFHRESDPTNCLWDI